MAEQNEKPTGRECAVRSVGLSEPVVELVDVVASTSNGDCGMLRPTAHAIRRKAPTRRVPSDDDEDSDTSCVSGASRSSEKRAKKRSRPPTGGDQVGLTGAKKLLIEQGMKALGLETEYRVLDVGETSTPNRSYRNLPCDDQVAREMRHEPTGGLGARIMEAVGAVERVASCSKNLKGTFVRELRLAAQCTRLASEELAKRSRGGGEREHLERENEMLRSQLDGLREEVRRLSGLVQRLQRTDTRTPPPLEARSSTENADVTVGRLEPPPPPTVKNACRASMSIPAGTALGPMEDRSDALLAKVGELIDRRLATFFLEAFPERASRPPLGKRAPSQKTTGAPKMEKPKMAGKQKVASVAAQADPSAPTTGVPTRKEPAEKETPILHTPKECGWNEVVGRKAAKKAAKKTAATVTPGNPRTNAAKPAAARKAASGKGVGNVKPPATSAKKKRTVPPRVPKTAAVTITVPVGGTVSYADAMRSVRQNIKLSDLGIESVRPRRAITGGLILEVPGAEGAQKAKALAVKMAETLAGTGVKVAQPTKMSELRVRGLDESVTPDEVAAALASVGACEVGDVKTGVIRRSPTGLGTLWVRCPATAARKVILAGRLMVGWISAKVEMLDARPLQCHRCLEKGHVRQHCTSSVDRSAICYNCGAPGHRAGQCTAKGPRCPLCMDAGVPADHRMGSKKCSPPKRKQKGGSGSQVPAASTTSAVASTGGKPACPVGDTQPAPRSTGLEEAMEVV